MARAVSRRARGPAARLGGNRPEQGSTAKRPYRQCIPQEYNRRHEHADLAIDRGPDHTRCGRRRLARGRFLVRGPPGTLRRHHRRLHTGHDRLDRRQRPLYRRRPGLRLRPRPTQRRRPPHRPELGPSDGTGGVRPREERPGHPGRRPGCHRCHHPHHRHGRPRQSRRQTVHQECVGRGGHPGRDHGDSGRWESCVRHCVLRCARRCVLLDR